MLTFAQKLSYKSRLIKSRISDSRLVDFSTRQIIKKEVCIGGTYQSNQKWNFYFLRSPLHYNKFNSNRTKGMEYQTLAPTAPNKPTFKNRHTLLRTVCILHTVLNRINKLRKPSGKNTPIGGFTYHHQQIHFNTKIMLQNLIFKNLCIHCY